MDAEERILVQLCLVAPDAQERAAIEELCAGGVDWERVYALARHNDVVPWLVHQLDALGLAGRLPEEQLAPMREEAERIAAANEARLAAGLPLLAELAEAGIEVVLLKGVLLAETVYGFAGYKRMNDIDVLVRETEVERVIDLMSARGFWCAAQLLGGSAKKQRSYTHHAPPFFSPDLACMIGTHWGLITPLAPYRIDIPSLWQRVEPVELRGVPLFGTSPTDTLHHLCVHLPYYKTGLRELGDIINLLRARRDAIDWPLLREEIARGRSEDLVYHALTLCQALHPLPEVAELLGAIEAQVRRFYRRDAQRKAASAARLLRSRSTWQSTIEKHFGELRMTRDWREKWRSLARMWRSMLIVPPADVARMYSSERAGLAQRLGANFRIRRVFYRDVGRLFFWVIMASCLWSAIKTTLRAPFVRDREADLAANARRLGVSLADLERLKEQLE